MTIAAFVATQNAYRGTAGIALDFDDSAGGPVPTGDNAVIGLQSESFTTGYNVMVLPNDLDTYNIWIDAKGDYSVTDTSSNITVTGTGLTAIVGDGGATVTGIGAGSGAVAYSEAVFVETAADAQIAALYQAALGRVPDMPGLEYWLNEFNAGKITMPGIAFDFANSAEFTTRFAAAALPADHGGPNDVAFITQLYSNVLGRAPDPAGLAYWTADLAAGDSRGDVLADFAVSTENMANVTVNSGQSLTARGPWLINEGQGGYVSPGVSLPASTVFAQAAITGYLNEALADSNTVENATVNVPAGGSITYSPTMGLVVTASNMTLAGNWYTELIGNNNAITMSASGQTGSSPFITVVGTNETINMAGTGTNVVISPTNISASTYTFGQNVTITGWIPGHDALQFETQGSLGGVKVLTPSIAAPASVSAQSNGSAIAYFIDVGNVGTGSATDVATAVNKVYQVSGQNIGNYQNGVLTVPEEAVFYGTSNSGNTVLVYWANSNNELSPVNTATEYYANPNNYSSGIGGHLVTAAEFVQTVTLVGINASQLTAADFK